MAVKRPPIVTNVDIEWAMGTMPPWCQRGELATLGEVVDDGGWLEDDNQMPENKAQKPSFAVLVAEEVEKFERHYNGESKTYADWTYLWRNEWWPRVNPRKRFPKSAPREIHPFFRIGTAEFDRALKIGTAHECHMWQRFGVAQFKPDDPRLRKVTRLG